MKDLTSTRVLKFEDNARNFRLKNFSTLSKERLDKENLQYATNESNERSR